MLLVSSDSGDHSSDGVWSITATGASLVASAPGLGALAIHPSRPLLFGLSRGDHDSLLVWSNFTLVTSVPLQGRGSCACTIVGDNLVVAHYESGEVSVVSLDHTGMPGSVTLLALTGSGPDEDRQEMSHPHHVVELEGAALIVDLGADRIWRIDLPSNDIATFTDVLAGSGPRHAVITPAGLAVSGELDATIMIAGVTSAPSSRFAAPTRIYPSDILWHPAGYIVMANRNADSLAVFSPSLELVHEISAGGAWPLNLALLSDHQIAVANRDSDVVAMFSLSSDGTLTREATHTIPRPTWVLALDPSRSANSPSSFQEEK